MRVRSFPALGRVVSEIGLGCWQLGAEWGPVSDECAQSVLHTANLSGVTFLIPPMSTAVVVANSGSVSS